MAFSDIQGSVTRLSPSQIGPSTVLAGDIVNDAYFQILRHKDWLWLRKQGILQCVKPYTAGSVTLTNASATVAGAGTTWTAAMVGRYLKVADHVPLRITAFGGAGSITIESAWPDTTIAGKKYEIIAPRYSLPVGGERIIRLAGRDWPILGRSQEMIDAIDPTRTWRGMPLVFSEAELRQATSTQKSLEVELWPVPDDNYMLTLNYRYMPAVLVDPLDVPIVVEDIISLKARAEACRILFGRMGDNNWLALSREYEGQFSERLDSLERDERLMKRFSPVVGDGEASNDGYDPDYMSWLRTINTLGLQHLA